MGDFTLTVKDFRLPNLERICREISDPSHPHWVEAGVFGGATDEDGVSVAEYAAYNEYGAPGAGIPKRSFLRSTMESNSDKYRGLLQNALKGLASSGASEPLRGALDAVGREMETDIIEKIKSNVPPANAPAYAAWKKGRRKVVEGGKEKKDATDEEKGYTGTLMLTGTMLGSVSYELTDGSGGLAE